MDVESLHAAHCRICHEGGELIQPCACRGFSGSVHEQCLERWRARSACASAKCEICGAPYLDSLRRPPGQVERAAGLVVLLLHAQVAFAALHMGLEACGLVLSGAKACNGQWTSPWRDALKRLFRSCDEDGDGKLSLSEVHDCDEPLSTLDVDQMAVLGLRAAFEEALNAVIDRKRQQPGGTRAITALGLDEWLRAYAAVDDGTVALAHMRQRGVDGPRPNVGTIGFCLVVGLLVWVSVMRSTQHDLHVFPGRIRAACVILVGFVSRPWDCMPGKACMLLESVVVLACLGHSRSHIRAGERSRLNSLCVLFVLLTAAVTVLVNVDVRQALFAD